jgi:hypothetical protein
MQKKVKKLNVSPAGVTGQAGPVSSSVKERKNLPLKAMKTRRSIAANLSRIAQGQAKQMGF